MHIIPAKRENLDQIMEIYAQARRFMEEQHNPQWQAEGCEEGYPQRALIERDMDKMYLCMEGEAIACVFYFAVETEEAYEHIDGCWQGGKPYGVVHRVASTGVTKGAAQFCLQWALRQAGSIRIDTYKDNVPMQRLLAKCGFVQRGTFTRPEETGDREWMAYEGMA